MRRQNNKNENLSIGLVCQMPFMFLNIVFSLSKCETNNPEVFDCHFEYMTIKNVYMKRIKNKNKQNYKRALKK